MGVVFLGHQASILSHGIECGLLAAEQFTRGIVLNDTTSIQHDDTGWDRREHLLVTDLHVSVTKYSEHWTTDASDLEMEF